MTNKQQIKHPSFTKGEILRMNYTISEVLEFLKEKEWRALFDKNICLHFFEVHPQNFDVDHAIEKIFKSNNAKKLKI